VAWVRYDDQFHTNAKVTAVIAENPAALALHVLANTWTNGQKRVGFIPKHQPGVLVCDRSQGAEWAEILTRHGLWHDVIDAPGCASCAQAYDGLDAGVAGYVIHDSHVYRAPARERQTPGTPAELSEKRRLAGSKGGKASGETRKQAKQSGRANEANDVSKTSKRSSKRVSPEPEPVVASNEATVPPSAGTAPPLPDARVPNAGDVVAAWVEAATELGNGDRPASRLVAQVGRQARELIDEGKAPERLVDAARRAGAKGFADLGRELLRDHSESRDQAKPRRKTDPPPRDDPGYDNPEQLFD
jgi:hypothetical protein